jgi:hypothetical protein
MKPAHQGLYRIEPLGRQHDRAGFCCGVESLDSYLKTHASQDIKRKANAVFVLVAEESPEKVAGISRSALTGLRQAWFPKRPGSIFRGTRR